MSSRGFLVATIAAAAALAPLVGGTARARSAGETIEVFDFTAPGERRKVSPDWTAIEGQPLGSVGNPVRAFMPPGQRAYIARLRCADGRPPSEVRRLGSVGAGPYQTIVDRYGMKCAERGLTFHIDMYHPGHVEEKAVPGFSIVPP